MNTQKKNSLSVCLIVKNEEAYLAECLESIREIADQLVIVDTGSTDRTLDIARSFNAEIYHFDWVNDFSAARNESIKYARCDWVLWIDADERLTKESVPVLKKLLKFEKQPVIYTIRIKNLQEDKKNFTLSNAHRLFTNHRRIQFTGKIHEQISPSAKKVGADERPCAVVLDHLGYSITGDEKSRKQARNRKILEAEVEVGPKNAYAHFTLAHNYKVDGELELAEKHYKIALGLDQFDTKMKASLLNTYADALFDLGRIDEVAPLIDKSLKLQKRQNAAHFIRYKYLLKLNDLQGAIQALLTIQNQYADIQNHGSGISTDLEIDKTTIVKTLGDLYTQSGKWVEAAKCYEECLAAKDDSVNMLRNYFKVLERLEDWHAALDILGKLVQKEGELPPYINAIATILIRMGEFEAALQTYLRLNQIQPDDSQLKRKIASLYAKLGMEDQARQWLASEK